jgi:hypothetical protein
VITSLSTLAYQLSSSSAEEVAGPKKTNRRKEKNSSRSSEAKREAEIKTPKQRSEVAKTLGYR